MVGKLRRRRVAAAVAASCAALSGSIVALHHGSATASGPYFVGGLLTGVLVGVVIVAGTRVAKRGKAGAC